VFVVKKRREAVMRLLFVCFLGMFVFVGCDLIGSITNPLIGTWVWELEEVEIVCLTIRADGTLTSSSGFSEDTEAGTWAATSSQITFTYGAESNIFYYVLSANKSMLTITPVGGGLGMTLVRKISG
jgi:hypothetical protein